MHTIDKCPTRVRICNAPFQVASLAIGSTSTKVTRCAHPYSENIDELWAQMATDMCLKWLAALYPKTQSVNLFLQHFVNVFLLSTERPLNN